MQFIKRFTPKSLFARAVLILILPLLLVQLVVAIIFFDRHWDEISTHLARSLAAEMSYMIKLYTENPGEAALKEARHVGRAMDIRLEMIAPNELLGADGKPVYHGVDFADGKGYRLFRHFNRALNDMVGQPYMIQDADKHVHLYVETEDGLLHLSANRKRLVSVTTTVFWLTMCGATIFFVTIALLFLRNQIVPIKQLAKAAERFGMGQDVNYQPRGAREVRQAGEAFIAMRDRIARQIKTRTDMLIGISHDLRTPLAQMKLELSLAEKNPAILKEMAADIATLEYMVNEYVLFAQSGQSESFEPVRLHSFVMGLVDSYHRNGDAVTLERCDSITLEARPHGLRRAFQNLIDNALHYGTSARVRLTAHDTMIEFEVVDKGPGIAPEDMAKAFQPFTRLHEGEHTGVGLGLSIAQDIVNHHGGTLVLENITDASDSVKGLKATITIPLQHH